MVDTCAKKYENWSNDVDATLPKRIFHLTLACENKAKGVEIMLSKLIVSTIHSIPYTSNQYTTLQLHWWWVS